MQYIILEKCFDRVQKIQNLSMFNVVILALAYLAAYFCSVASCSLDETVCDASGSDLFDYWREQAEIHGGHHCSVAIVTYATNSSIQYSAYAVAVNTIYALANGYRVVVLGDQLASKYAHESAVDPRWNKISILQASLDPKSGWARDCDFVLWLDSDLVVLDATLNLSDIGARYPHADIIMSRDMATAPFVSNSGAVLVRNTDWARAFLRMWWSTFDKDRCCDQNAFTWLYDRDMPSDIKQRTALLPVDAINTDFPAWKNQQPHNPILHLAGLTSLYRSEVFRTGYRTVCAALLALQETSAPHHTHITPVSASALKDVIPPQLGLTRQYLFSTMRRLNGMRRLGLDQLVNESAVNIASCIEDARSPEHMKCEVIGSAVDESIMAQGWRQRLEDVMKFDDDEKEHYTPADIDDMAALRAAEVLVRERIFCTLYRHANRQYDMHRDNAMTVSGPAALEQLEAVKEAASTGFELVIASNNWELSTHTTHTSKRQVLVLDLVTQVLDTALLSTGQHIPTQIRGAFLYHKFKALQLMAGSYQRGKRISSDPPASINLLSQASQAWEEMLLHNYHGTGYVSADPDKEYVAVLGELALLQCIEQHHELGKVTFAKAIELQKRIIHGYSTIRIATEDIIIAAKVSLVESYINYAQCILDSHADGEETAAHLAYIALQVMEECNLPDTDHRKLRAHWINEQYSSTGAVTVRRKLRKTR